MDQKNQPRGTGDAIVEVNQLRRTYVVSRGILKVTTTRREALKGVSFEVQTGELFGLLGPNGAGKTTLTKILSTILLPTAGSARINGYDVVEQTEQVRRSIGVVLGGERGLYYRLTALENMQYWAALYRLDSAVARQRIPYLLDLVGLSQRAHERVEHFSRGMKQRLHLARGLIGAPRVIFLDEPSVGLDPVAIIELRGLIRQLQREGLTIFLTTHQMSEAEALCNRVAFINEGQIVLLDTPRALTRAAGDIAFLEASFAPTNHICVEQLRQVPGIQQVDLQATPDDQTALLQLESKSALPEALRALSELNPLRLNSREPSLEDVYIRLMGHRGLKV